MKYVTEPGLGLYNESHINGKRAWHWAAVWGTHETDKASHQSPFTSRHPDFIFGGPDEWSYPNYRFDSAIALESLEVWRPILTRDDVYNSAECFNQLIDILDGCFSFTDYDNDGCQLC